MYKLEELDNEGVVRLFERWNMDEFVEFVKEKEIDGRQLCEITEGIVKLWQPTINAEKLLSFLEDLKINPDKYLKTKTRKSETIESPGAIVSIERQYQTVKVRRVRDEQFKSATAIAVEDILKKVVPPKSFLYRNQPRHIDKPITPYVPMEPVSPKRPRKSFFRLSSYEYPHFDLQLKFSRKSDSYNDRGYYSIKSNNRFYVQKSYRKTETRTKYKSVSSTDDIDDKFTDDHYYEDLNYNDTDKNKNDKSPDSIDTSRPRMVKIQDLFRSLKLPFFKKNIEGDGCVDLDKGNTRSDGKNCSISENSDSAANMYDSIHVVNEGNSSDGKVEKMTLAVEDYLEPIQVNKDYCDVDSKDKEDSLLGFIMSIFESRFGFRKEASDTRHPEISTSELSKDVGDHELKWTERKHRPNMADRPLPVPIENEPYYMEVDRNEAENLLKGQPDGTFILRPSSQPNHVYTLSVSCSSAVHNVGVRRRTDGRLALGFARRGERSFPNVTSLLRHHRKRRLLLVAAGGLIGATTLNEPPEYYQTPNNIPVQR